ncbi:MAG: M28 family metallopeptidase [Thermoplasmatota archaeon]
MRTHILVVLLAFLALLAPGCVTLPAATPHVRGLASANNSTLLPDLTTVPPPSVDAHRARLWWETFVNTHPERETQTPTNQVAAGDLARDLEMMGYQTKTLYYVPATGGRSPTTQGIRAVVGIRRGLTQPDHAIAVIAHYDSVVTTIYGAYDDGSGTSDVMETARVLAAYPNQKTIMIIFFDAEEEGLLASSYFAKEASGNANETFDMVIGHDMTGINCPGYHWPMAQFIGERYLAEIKPVLEALYAEKLSPAENQCISFQDQDNRNSDELSFKAAGVPILRLAGGLNATDYPAYHMPTDTVAFVENFTGGPANYEKGVNLTVTATYWAVATYDRLPSLR